LLPEHLLDKNMEKPIKTGILSFGMSGKIFHSPFLDAHDGFELTAVVERSEKKAFQYYPYIKSYTSVEELLDDPNIELVVVNTPNLTHFDYALKCLHAGKNVLMEKPFTITSDEAKQLFQVATKSRLKILPYQNRRFDSDCLSIRNIIDSGKLGQLVEVHIRYDRFRDTISPKLFKETPGPGSGLMYDLGPHLLDQAISLFGKPLHWKKTLGIFRKNSLVDDYVHIHLEFPQGLNVFLTASLMVIDAQPGFVIHGTRGSYIKQRTDSQEKQLLAGMSPDNPNFGLEESGKEGILTTLMEDGSTFQEKIISEKSTYLNLFDQVFQCIRHGALFPVTEDQIIQQLEILEG